MTSLVIVLSLIAKYKKLDDFPKQNTNVLSYIINENRFCFHQFLNIFFKAAIVFLLIIAVVDTNPCQNPPTDSIVDVQSSTSDLSITSSISTKQILNRNTFIIIISVSNIFTSFAVVVGYTNPVFSL
jgi:hypothetical protein